jgi:hypothetical protein
MCRRGPGQKPGLIRFMGPLSPLRWLVMPRKGEKDDQKNHYDENACHSPVLPSWFVMIRARCLPLDVLASRN